MDLLQVIVNFHRSWILDGFGYVSSLSSRNADEYGSRRGLETDDSMAPNKTVQLDGFKTNVYVNLLVFVVVMIVFESVRGINRLYVCRRTKGMVKSGLVPDNPVGWPLRWLKIVHHVEEDDFLRMAGLDAYMMIRYIKACIKIATVYSLMGFIVLVPIYYTGEVGLHSTWNKYTISNTIVGSDRLWAVVIMAYLMAAAYCSIMKDEYIHFLERRMDYFNAGGDKHTPLQTSYTVMLDRIPPPLRSKKNLKTFFEHIMPGQVYCLEMAYDLKELDTACKHRRNMRDNLEDAIALWRGSSPNDVPSEESRPKLTVWPCCWKPTSSAHIVSEKCCCGKLTKQEYDAIDYWAAELTKANDLVVQIQTSYFSDKAVMEMETTDDDASDALLSKIQGNFEKGLSGLQLPSELMASQLRKFKRMLRKKEEEIRIIRLSETGRLSGLQPSHGSELTSCLLQPGSDAMIKSANSSSESLNNLEIGVSGLNSNAHSNTSSPLHNTPSVPEGEEQIFTDVPTPKKPQEAGRTTPTLAAAPSPTSDMKSDHAPEKKSKIRKLVGGIASEVKGIAKESKKVGGTALGGIYSTIKVGLSDLKMITIGAHYKTGSTAFVTFKTRVACSMAAQMFLSYDYYGMKIVPAPQPGDIQWDNVHVAEQQVESRKSVANFIFFLGGLFWSVVVSAIATISNLDELAKKYPWIAAYEESYFYSILNSYLAALILIIALAILPFIFYFCAKLYEGIKLESEIQASVMARYFWYQIVNVIVSVQLGSVLTNWGQNISQPTNLLKVLGNALPGFSLYFTNLIIVKTFTAIPLDLLRLWPLLQMWCLKLFINENRCSWRYLHTGLFAPPVMDYAWIYPSLLMILMIINMYATVAPAVVPMALVYFIFMLYLYKYQLLYLFQNEYQSGGILFIDLYEYTMLALVVGALMLLSYFVFLTTTVEDNNEVTTLYFAFLIPLPLLIYWYKTVCVERYMLPSQQMSLQSCVERDQDYQAYADAKKAGVAVTSPTTRLSENKVKLNRDGETIVRKSDSHPPVASQTTPSEVPIENFREDLFVQPSLVEGIAQPLPYRKLHDLSALVTASNKHLDIPDNLNIVPSDLAPPPVTPVAAATPESSARFSHSRPSGLARLSEQRRTQDLYVVNEEFFGVDAAGMDDKSAPRGEEQNFTSNAAWVPVSQPIAETGEHNDDDDKKDSRV